MMERVLTFYLNDELFGIDIKLVKEINRKIKFTKVPGAPEKVVGLFNMRGQVVTIFDISYILHKKGSDMSREPTCIILKNQEADSEYVGFLVDKPDDVVDTSEKWSESMPENMECDYCQYIKEIMKCDDRLATILDIHKVFG